MSKLDTLDPVFRKKVDILLLDLLKQTGYQWGVVSAYRSIAEQNKLYEQPLHGLPKVTNAKGGQSPHNFKMAVDLVPMKTATQEWWEAPESLWKQYGEIARSLGLTWGGDFKSIKDRPHVEDPRWKELQAKWKRGEIHID